MYSGQSASRQTLHKQGVTAGEEGREGWRTAEVSHEEGDKRDSPVKGVDREVGWGGANQSRCVL